MSYTALQELGRTRLDSFVEIGLGAKLWSVQKEIARELSKPRARVCVPSCNASGKSFLSGALALAFYSCFPESKVITTSSKFDQLKQVLWGEIRRHYENKLVPIPGRLLPGALELKDGPQHFIVGHAPNSREGFQGYHAPQKLIIADEATAVDEELASGINALLSSGDARLLLIFNPTGDDTWAAQMCQSGDFKVIKIRAWDTPNFSGEEVPPGSNLVTPAWLEELKAQGMGPSTYEWETRVEASFWHSGENQLIEQAWYEKALTTAARPGRLVLGVDMAPYSQDENVLAWRRGNCLERIEIFPSMRPDLFWNGVIGPRVREHKPDLVVYDADGVGAGVIGEAERACGRDKILPFRGAISVGPAYRNVRSLWWWRLRGHFESGNIRINGDDDKLRKQLLQIRYQITDTGAIKIESKDSMHRRGLSSPDRADAMMYAFSVDPPEAQRNAPHPNSDTAMWLRTIREVEGKRDRKRKQALIDNDPFHSLMR